MVVVVMAMILIRAVRCVFRTSLQVPRVVFLYAHQRLDYNVLGACVKLERLRPKPALWRSCVSRKLPKRHILYQCTDSSSAWLSTLCFANTLMVMTLSGSAAK